MKIKVNFLKATLLLLLFAATSGFALAQRTISGLVTDKSNGETLIGASVIVTGTTKGTLTDVDGKYSLDVPADATSLTFSFTGYSSLTIPLGASNVVNAPLEGGTTLQTFVVNSGYVSLKSQEVTNSITSVRSGEFNKGNINEASQLLQGKVAGLTISRPSGNPNANPEIRLRGISTISGNTQPLVVVDGIPGVSLNSVDPNDILTMDVLKDGSAAAIYGTQGSSGVILITTKKGTIGTTSAEYNVQLVNESIANTPKYMDAAQFKAANAAAGNATADKGNTTDWLDLVTRTANSQTHSLSLGGGLSKGTTYRASFNYRDAQGVSLKDGFKQLNGRFNLTQTALDDKLKVTFDAAATNRNAEYAFDEGFRYAVTYNPTAPVYSTDAAFAPYGGYHQIGGFDTYNPVALVNQSTNTGQNKRINLNARAEYEILSGLSVSALYGKATESDLNGTFYSTKGLFRGGAGGANLGYASRFTEDRVKDFFNSLVTYKVKVDKLDVNVLAGYEQQVNNKENFRVQARNLPSEGQSYNSVGSTNATTVSDPGVRISSFKARNQLVSYLGRVGLNYDDTYFGQVSLRRDGSSMLAEGKKTGVFYSVSGGANLNKILKLNNVDNLKLRVGYGTTGALPRTEYLNQTLYKSSIGVIELARNPSNFGWERKAELNAGIDFGVLGNRLTGSVDYYSRNITDMLYYFGTIPGTELQGADAGLWANAGNLTSSGIEVAVNYNVIKAKSNDDLNWVTSFNFSTLSSVLNKLSTDQLKIGAQGRLEIAAAGLPGTSNVNYVLVEEGKTLGQLYGYKYAGVDAAGNAKIFNKEGVAVPLADGKSADKVVIGNGLPKFTFGWSNSLRYGAFDFNIFLRGVLGHQLMNEYRITYENADKGETEKFNRIQTKYYDAAYKQGPRDVLDRFVEKADFLRIDNITLGYTLKLPAAASNIFKNARVFASANNVATFTGYTGVNPEPIFVDYGGGNNGAERALVGDPLAIGIDRRSNYFTTRSFNIGLSLGF
jgi:TonB-dependent starch-binding outer membrane protein SusC